MRLKQIACPCSPRAITKRVPTVDLGHAGAPSAVSGPSTDDGTRRVDGDGKMLEAPLHVHTHILGAGHPRSVRDRVTDATLL